MDWTGYGEIGFLALVFSYAWIEQDRVGLDWIPGSSQLSSLLGPFSGSQVHSLAFSLPVWSKDLNISPSLRHILQILSVFVTVREHELVLLVCFTSSDFLLHHKVPETENAR